MNKKITSIFLSVALLVSCFVGSSHQLSAATEPYDSNLTFDGQDDTVSIENIQTNTSFGGKNTVEFWMYWDGNTFQMPITFSKDANYNLYFTDGYFGFNTAEGNIIGVPYDGLENRWVHVAAVFYNGVPNEIDNELYLDGVKQPIIDLLGNTVTSVAVADGLIISGWYYDEYYKFQGKIADVRVWNKARTQSEIQSDMHNELVGIESGLVGYWKLNSFANGRVYDATSNHNTGIISGYSGVDLKLTKQDVTETSATLNWDTYPGATGYVLEKDGEEVYNGSQTTFVDNSLVDGTTYNYTVRAKNYYGETIGNSIQVITPTENLSSNVNLTSVTLSKGAIYPYFDKAIQNYKTSLDYEVTSVSVTPVAEDNGSTIEVNGIATTSGTPSTMIDLEEGANVITIKVTSQDGSQSKEYKINVKREFWSDEQTLNIFKETYLYDEPYGQPTEEIITPQFAQKLDKDGEFYKINTWLGEKWIQSQAVTVKVSRTMDTTKRLSLYANPGDDTDINESISPQTVNEIEEWGDFYKMKTWIGDLWIEPNINYSVQLNEKTTLYKSEDPSVATDQFILPQTVYAVEKSADGEYKIRTWLGFRWIKPTDFIETPVL